MQWQRAKTILILVFFLINVLLISYLVIERTPSDAQRISDLTEVLSRNRIQLEMVAVPRIPDSVFVPEWNRVELELKQVEALMDTPVADEKGYTNPDKTCRLTLKEDQIFYENQAPKGKNFRNVTAKNVHSKLKGVLKTLGVEAWVYPVSITEVGEDFVVTYGYQVEKRKLNGSWLTVTVSQNGIKKMEGFLGIPDRKNGFSYRLSQLETVLMSLVQTEESPLTITDIELGYYLIPYTDALVSQAIPVYEIETSEGILLLDARDGVSYLERKLSSQEKGASYEKVSAN